MNHSGYSNEISAISSIDCLNQAISYGGSVHSNSTLAFPSLQPKDSPGQTLQNTPSHSGSHIWNALAISSTVHCFGRLFQTSSKASK